eukprot:2714305-Amphidinium_carterae.1
MWGSEGWLAYNSWYLKVATLFPQGRTPWLGVPQLCERGFRLCAGINPRYSSHRLGALCVRCEVYPVQLGMRLGA